MSEQQVQAICHHDDGFEHPSDGTLTCPCAEGRHRYFFDFSDDPKWVVDASAVVTAVVCKGELYR